MLNAVFVFDPASPAALDIGTLVAQLDAQSLPLRIGLLPVVALSARSAGACALFCGRPLVGAAAAGQLARLRALPGLAS